MSVHKANLDVLASTGLPIYITELDIDGPTDEVQLEDYQRVFPVFWEHPAVRGITLWGYRVGSWRSKYGAYLVREDDGSRALRGMRWIREQNTMNVGRELSRVSQRLALRSRVRGSTVAIGSIERFDPAFDAIVAEPDARVETDRRGFHLGRRPGVDSRRAAICCSPTCPGTRCIDGRAADGLSRIPETVRVRRPAFSGLREAGANGLFPIAGGAVLLADSGNRLIARLSLASREKITLASRHDGRRFNSPNDLVQRSDGAIYFTDPPYGLERLNDSPLKELAFNGVFRLDPSGRVSVIDDQLSFPNGIALSPDERTLYVANSDAKRPIWIAYDWMRKALSQRGACLPMHPTWSSTTAPGLPDGMTVDAQGHLFATAPGGVLVMTAEGRRLGLIRTGGPIANCEIGDNGRTLYMTSKNVLARVRLATQGGKH